jgi:hypothetical protein
MELSKQVYDICYTKIYPSTELRAFLDAHPQVSVTKYRDQMAVAGLRFIGRQS